MSKSWRKSLLIFITCSLFIHTFFWAGLRLSGSTRPPAKNDHVEIEIRDESAIRPNHAQQIVEQQQQLNDQVDEKAKYLSAFNQKVEKQTKSANRGQFQNAAAAGQKAQPATAAPQPETAEGTTTKNSSTQPTLSSLVPQFKPQPPRPEVTGDEGEANQASATDDYLKDVESGLQTMLSTREFVYYSYYSRIKERIRQHWEPSIRSKVKMIYRQGRSIASTKDHVTQVVITLNNQGELVRVDVVTPSGLEQLDDAAVEAFRAAQPFPNPPKGLVDDDGLIKIRWDFVLEASSYRPRDNNHNYHAEGYGYETDSSRRL